MGRRAEVLEASAAVEAAAGMEMPLKEQMIFTASTDWSPDQAEQYIDWRIQQIDTEIARLREQLDDHIASRKRWLAVTGGRSKMFATGNGTGNGSGNGHSAANPS